MRALTAVVAAVCAAPAVAAPDVQTRTYQCERGVRVPATYVTAAEGSVVVLNVEGRQITLMQAEAASGARYAWPSDGAGYVWWTKGDEATLYWRTGGGSPDETPLLSACRAEG